MYTIHKHVFEFDTVLLVPARFSDKVLTAARNRHGGVEQVAVWVQTDVSQMPSVFEEHRFVAVPTGGEAPYNYAYVGSAHEIEGWMVWHVFHARVPK